MFAVMKDTDYASKKQFIENFMHDWRLMLGKNHIIKKFELCDFTPIYEWHLKEKEKKKQMTSEVNYSEMSTKLWQLFYQTEVTEHISTMFYPFGSCINMYQ